MIQAKYKKCNNSGSFAINVNGLALSNEELKNLTVLFEPKMEQRFIVRIGDIPPYLVKETQLPSFDIDETGTKFYKQLKMKLYDPIYPSGTTAVMDKLDSGTSWDFTIIYLGPVGDIIQKWEVINPRVASVDFSPANWSGDKPAEIILTFDVKSARLVEASGLL